MGTVTLTNRHGHAELRAGRYITAWHELGHAVCAAVWGLNIDRTRIAVYDDAGGHCDRIDCGGLSDQTAAQSARLICAVGGAAAEREIVGFTSVMCASDYTAAARIAAILASVGAHRRNAISWMRWAETRAAATVAVNHHRIEQAVRRIDGPGTRLAIDLLGTEALNQPTASDLIGAAIRTRRRA